jgi:hypothetical protein
VRCYGNALGIGVNLAVSLLDLSETGVRLVLNTEVKPGQEVTVYLEGLVMGQWQQVATVEWVVPTASGQFCVGVRFQKALPYTALTRLSRL